jgi:hypothetical protein
MTARTHCDGEDGTSRSKVPNYSFAWQIGYALAKPVLLPNGASQEREIYVR